MKICQLCAVDFTLKKFILPLVDAQINAGHDVVCVCSEGQYTKDLRDVGYSIESISISRSFNIFRHISSVFKLYQFLKRNSFDVLHVHTPVAAMIGRLAGFLARVPLVIYTAHGFYFHENMNLLQKSFFISLEFIFGLITDVVFTQSEEDAHSARQYKIRPKKHIYAIGNGVDIRKFDPSQKYNSQELRKSLSIPQDSFVIGVICRLVKEKGIDEFLKAAQEINLTNKNCHFLIVGERQAHDHAQGIEDSIKSAEKALGKNLILTGYRSDIPQLLKIMDLYVLPSWREGMPRSIIEAMMMSLPVLATDIRGSREEVIHNQTGLLVPVRSPCLLAKAMTQLINNPKLAKNMGENGRKRALKYYDEKKVIDLQLDIINRYSDKLKFN
tara:strand:- start:1714 stop:2868 length:1155 start_codon:yes stop_codon:yes gene_type:complete